jgi:hypothetical protein
MFSGKFPASGEFTAADAKLDADSTYIAPRGTDYKLSDACNPDETKRIKMEIVPPAEVTISANGTVFGPDAPITNAGTTAGVVDDTSRPGRKKCEGTGGAQFYMAGNQDSADGLEQIQLSGQFDISKGIPDDYWKLNLNGNVAAQYNLNVTRPVDADGHDRIFVPRFSFTLDANKKITGYQVKFSVWNAAKAAYEDVTDLASARQVIDGMGVQLMGGDNNARVEGRLYFDASKGADQSDEDWYGVKDEAGLISFATAHKGDKDDALDFTVGTGAATDLTQVFLYYKMGGNSYNFTFAP